LIWARAIRGKLKKTQYKAFKLCIYLKKIIEGSGHPVSLKVSTILQRKGWFVANGARYPSTQEPDVFKEIDVIGEKRSTLFPEAYNNLIIECKKQKDPWIFSNKIKKSMVFTF
jgi:hypothetical protein